MPKNRARAARREWRKARRLGERQRTTAEVAKRCASDGGAERPGARRPANAHKENERECSDDTSRAAPRSLVAVLEERARRAAHAEGRARQPSDRGRRFRHGRARMRANRRASCRMFPHAGVPLMRADVTRGARMWQRSNVWGYLTTHKPAFSAGALAAVSGLWKGIGVALAQTCPDQPTRTLVPQVLRVGPCAT